MKTLLKLLFIITCLALLAACTEDENPGPVDKTGPTIETISPEDGETEVSVMANVEITFSENLDAASVNSSTLNLKMGSETIPCSITVSGQRVVVNPTTDLEYSTEYTMTIGSGITDEIGNRLTGSKAITFTTEAQPDEESPTVIKVSPENGSSNVAISSPVVVTFSEMIASASVNADNFTLTEGSTRIAGNVVINGSEAIFTPSSALNYEMEYTVFVGSSISDESGNAMGSDRTFTFITELAPDTEKPNILSIVPQDAATDVDLDANIVITFSESIDLNSVSDGTVTLTTPLFTNNIQVEVTISENVMTINPIANFEEGAEYTLTLSTGLTDLAGNGLAEEFVSSFTTYLDPAPYVISSNPASGANNVSIDRSFEIFFSEEMDENTISFRFNFSGGFSSSGTITKNGTKITITPSNPLRNDTEYTLLIYSSAKDLAGNSMESNYSLNFKTEAGGYDLPSDFNGNWHNTAGTWIYAIADNYIRTGNVYYYFSNTDVSLSNNVYQVNATSSGNVSKSFWLKLSGADNRIWASKNSATDLTAYGKVVGRTVSYVKGDKGHEFVEISSGVWEERTPSGAVNSFTEQSRDEWSVYLLKSDGAKIQLDCYLEKIKIKGLYDSSYSDLYSIVEMRN